MIDVLTTLLELIGFVLIVVALWIVWFPLGLLAAGVACVALGYLVDDRYGGGGR